MLWQKQAPNFPKTGQLKHSGARCHLKESGGIVPHGHLGAENENLKAKEVTRAKKKKNEMKQLSPLRYILITGTVTLIKSLLIHCHKSPSGVQAPKMCPGRGDGCEELQHPLIPASPGHRGALAAPLGGQMVLSILLQLQVGSGSSLPVSSCCARPLEWCKGGSSVLAGSSQGNQSPGRLPKHPQRRVSASVTSCS